MNQTPSMTLRTASRRAWPDCITFCATRPAKSFWKKLSDWRMT